MLVGHRKRCSQIFLALSFVLGSHNRKKAVRRLAKLHRQIKSQRRNTLHQFTTRLAKIKSVLVIEDLNVSGML